MKTSIFSALVAAGLILTPAVMWAQSSTANPSGSPQGGRGETAGQPQAGSQTNAGQTTPAVPNTDASANRDATAAGDNRTEAQKSNANANEKDANNRAAAARGETPALTAEERRQAREARREAREERQDNAQERADRRRSMTSDQNENTTMSSREQFGKLDADSSGGLSQAEFANFSPVIPNPTRDASSSTGVGRNGTGPGTPGSTTGSTGGIVGKDNDADRSRTEQTMTPQQRFQALDIDNNGILSPDEFARISPVNPDEGRDASSSTSAGRNGTGPGTPGSTTGSTEASTENLNGKKD
ncbi:EF hand [Prosthecobacter debontii]|uniref:EF hand n=1 Tax=Prosthecobacter debontii TaxID=48467 RepID=A0A1T4YD60_9BACT|nr:hypothetical protein [Prosthecobacter debontii]SKA99251.1 EF hand [Prosthecobacter debontii]